MQGRLFGALVGLLLLALPASALGAQAVTKGHVFDLTLAGDRVVWDALERNDSLSVVSGQPGAPPTELLHFPPLGKHKFQFPFGLAGSSQGVAVARAAFVEQCPHGRRRFCRARDLFTQLLSGPLTGPIEPIAGGSVPRKGRPCTGDLVEPQGLDVSDDLIAASELFRQCVAGKYGEPVARLVTYPLSGGSPTVIATSASEEDLGYGLPAVSSAGRYIAWLNTPLRGDEPRIDVYDRISRSIEYTVPPEDAFATFFTGFDLQADGKLALLNIGDLERSIKPHPAWYSIQEPTPHILPVRAALLQTTRIADDQIVFGRARRKGYPGKPKSLVVSKLDGSARVIRRFTRNRQMGFSDDFDGSHVAWTERVGKRGHRHTSILLDSVPVPVKR